MKIHQLNCGTMCPRGSHFFPSIVPKEIVCQCLLIELGDRLILIDTGLGGKDIKNRANNDLAYFFLRPQLNIEDTAFEQIKKLGLSPEDVTDIIPTHLDHDHAGGITDFKRARVHINSIEIKATHNPQGFFEKGRYLMSQLSGPIQWKEFDLSQGEKWNNFDCVQSIEGLPPEILLVSLPGHSLGHMGIAIQTKNNWILHAGDAYYHHNDLVQGQKSPLGLNLLQRIVHSNYKLALKTQEKLAEIKNDPKIKMFCSHDPEESANLEL